ncbi:MAG: response regulator [Candidatus Hydrogenedentes bacterium]|nr:response regulator [Candidatus Hydrogenedentota bacterium]
MRKDPVEIIVIEDKMEDRKSIVAALSRIVPAALIADFDDDRSALHFIRAEVSGDPKRSAALRLIVLDFHLKNRTAPRVIGELRAQKGLGLIPVVILSDSGDTKDIRESYEHGANAFIRKPVDFGEFNETVDLIGRFWLEANESGS